MDDLGRYKNKQWCPGPELNRYNQLRSADFKSAVSTNSTTRAYREIFFIVEIGSLLIARDSLHKSVTYFYCILNLSKNKWRRDPESNRASWICNPEHNRFAIAPF